MTNEEQIKKEMTEKFPFLADKIMVKRVRRIFTEPLTQEEFTQVFTYATDEAGFVILCTISGLEEDGKLVCVYHLARENGIVLNLKIQAPLDNPVIKTVTGRFPQADLYEREIADLLGAKVEGLPQGRRYPLPDDWPEGQHPLRKDWIAQEAKNQQDDSAALQACANCETMPIKKQLKTDC